jgi:hypothetical protein
MVYDIDSSSKFSKKFLSELKRIREPEKLESELRSLLATVADSSTDQLSRDHGGYILV